MTRDAPAPSAEDLIAAWLGESVLQGFSLGAASPDLHEFKGKDPYKSRKWRVGEIGIEVDVIMRDGSPRRIASAFTLRCAGLDDLLGSLAAPLLAMLKARLGEPHGGRTNKKGDGEWKWKTDTFYGTASWRIRKVEVTPKAFEPALTGHVFVATYGD